ncbi:ABC transporter permease [Azospirillum picis]|uniref:NitT/TauT family transport system permease protein n=1 Tax=Azospirillum picis TaxID=488438 RepID=A0ABU0MMV5_9PROT|nr:ABC transporter permease [Azospirillum picis]MBP2301233.1 NitT/TauT family transport system permease protein [Azospirillum picis]MDQ0534804.1 NitT/TauT family transport system permease protein [Azospirillum picis]
MTRQASGRPGQDRAWRRRLLSPWLTTPCLLALALLAWNGFVTHWRVSGFILPAPGPVLAEWGALLLSPGAWLHTGLTVLGTLAGFLLAAGFGIAAGILLSLSPTLERLSSPFIVAFQVFPKVALIPLFVVWLGFGLGPKVLTAAILPFYPVMMNTLLGIRSVPEGLRDIMASFGAGRLPLLRRLELPYALPFVFAGLEVGIVLSLVGTVVAEFVSGSSGLGYLLVSRINSFETAQMFAIVLHLCLVGLVLHGAVRLLRRRIPGRS